MKNLNNLLVLSFLAIFATSCEKESIDSPDLKANQAKNLSANPDFQGFNSVGDFDNYARQISNGSKSKSLFKEMTQIGGLTMTSSIKEFSSLCSETLTEDFSAVLEGEFGFISGKLDTNTNQGPIAPGDIQPGLAFSTGSGSMVAINSPFLGSSIFSFGLSDTFNVEFDEGVNSLGLDIFNMGSGDVLVIELMESGNAVETASIPFSNGQKTFVGLNSNSNFDSVKLSWKNSLGSMVLDVVSFGSCSSDADGDGCMDADDPFVNSNMEEFITMGDCDTGVANQITSECGVMMADLIENAQETSKNHGQFVSSVAHLVKAWVEEGLISTSEKGKIVNCAGKWSN